MGVRDGETICEYLGVGHCFRGLLKVGFGRGR
jgi:hypothetical protein